MTDSARFRGSNAELCEFLERKNAELEVERDRCRAALSGLLDAADHYCAMYTKHGGSHIHCGTAWTRMYRERVTAREALGDD